MTSSLQALRDECCQKASSFQTLIRSDLDQIVSSLCFLEEKVRGETLRQQQQQQQQTDCETAGEECGITGSGAVCSSGCLRRSGGCVRRVCGAVHLVRPRGARREDQRRLQRDAADPAHTDGRSFRAQERRNRGNKEGEGPISMDRTAMTILELLPGDFALGFQTLLTQTQHKQCHYSSART